MFKNTKTSNYFFLVICGFLTLLGLFQLFTNKVEDGILNLIIGTSLGSSFLPIDYKKAPVWQKILLSVYAIVVILATIYLISKIFR
jgi:hypothetical protein